MSWVVVATAVAVGVLVATGVVAAAAWWCRAWLAAVVVDAQQQARGRQRRPGRVRERPGVGRPVDPLTVPMVGGPKLR